MAREYSLADLLARPRVTFKSLAEALATTGNVIDVDENVGQQVEIQIKYQGYINRQQEEIEKQKCQENTAIPEDFDYKPIPGLSNELKQKLLAQRPENIGRAARIPGMTPAAISLLLVYLKKHQAVKQKAG
ncbi:MAG: hypothetical protein WD772_01800, partial [Pseudohongiellaceae bacterium]